MARELNQSSTNRTRLRKAGWGYIIAAGCGLVILLAIVVPKTPSTRNEPSGARETVLDHKHSGSYEFGSQQKAAGTPEEIVASKVEEFARDRLRITRAMAKRGGIELPPEVEQFYKAVSAGNWEELNDLYKALAALRDNPGGERLRSLWGPILETLLIAECAHLWPAQKLLEYGQATIGSLSPGMVYVGGTDPGRGIPTLLNETSQGDRHIVLTQNGLADGSYLDYLRFLYNDQIRLPTEEEVSHAFSGYIADAQKRFEHDRQFPDEPKQVRPGEEIQMAENGGQGSAGGTNQAIRVSGQVAVMGINERILQTIIDNNPGMSFALEESFPLLSTYASAAPLGPIMELRAADPQNAFTPESATKALDYWRTTATELSLESEAPEGSEVRKTYSHMASAQANLLAAHNFNDEAEQTYRLAMAMEPSNPEAVCALAGLLERNGRTEEARELVEDFGRKHPGQGALPVPWVVLEAGTK